VLAAVFVSDMTRTERLFQTVNDWLERVLKRVLPPKIVDRLRLQERTFAEKIDNCSILFADIVGFTNYCRKHSAIEVVAILSKIFSEFDDLARKHGVEKIKTIGDAYMAASGVLEKRNDHAIAISGFALDLLDWMKSIDGFEIRIGINSGSVVAGLIGKDRFVYDLWGDVVNIASRMESTGKAGVIQITNETAKLVSKRYCVSPHGNVEAKGIGIVDVFYLEKKGTTIVIKKIT
jgi:class 3 adenylate cyclase